MGIHLQALAGKALPATTAPTSVVEAWEACDKIDTLFVAFCAATCWLVIPAIGMAYSGYSIKRNGLSSYFPALIALALISIQWWAWGYTLAFSDGTGFLGGFQYLFHQGVLAEPVGTIPAMLFSFFQLLFCATVGAMSIGGGAERIRLVALVPLVLLWSTFVYCPMAHMVWTEGGWLARLGVYDFAGGTCVHVVSGASATAISVYLSHPHFRSKKSSVRTPAHIQLHKPHNIHWMLLGMILIWSCWLPFEAGTALALNFKAINALVTAHFSAASGSVTWSAWTYLEEGRWSLDSAVLGMMSGLVMITPAAGFVGVTDSVVLGVIGALIIRQMLRFKFTSHAQNLKWVDPADVFATHAFGGIIATLGTGVFASKAVAGYDGFTEIPGGVWYDGNWYQLIIQAIEAFVGATWAFGATYGFMCLIDLIPGLEVLATDDQLKVGMDAAQLLESFTGEHAADEEDYHPHGHLEGGLSI